MILLLLSSFLEKLLLLQRLYVEEYGLLDYSMASQTTRWPLRLLDESHVLTKCCIVVAVDGD